jgi:hypothetical protein
MTHTATVLVEQEPRRPPERLREPDVEQNRVATSTAVDAERPAPRWRRGHLTVDLTRATSTEPTVPARSEATFSTLERWEGHVVEVTDDGFVAHLTKGSRQLGPDEQAEFDREEVSPDDLELLRPGAVFYWTTGYETAAHGQRQIVSRLRFQRLPPPTDEELEVAWAAAARRIAQRGWTPA